MTAAAAAQEEWSAHRPAFCGPDDVPAAPAAVDLAPPALHATWEALPLLCGGVTTPLRAAQAAVDPPFAPPALHATWGALPLLCGGVAAALQASSPDANTANSRSEFVQGLSLAGAHACGPDGSGASLPRADRPTAESEPAQLPWSPHAAADVDAVDRPARPAASAEGAPTGGGGGADEAGLGGGGSDSDWGRTAEDFPAWGTGTSADSDWIALLLDGEAGSS
jgi:hypothetical protein